MMVFVEDKNNAIGRCNFELLDNGVSIGPIFTLFFYNFYKLIVFYYVCDDVLKKGII